MEPIQLGSLTLFPFGLIVGLCAIPALVCAGLGMKRRGLRAETASWFALLSVPLALLLSRLVYCLMQLDVLLGSDDWGMFLRLPEGGFVLWGAVAGGLLAAWLTGKITRQKGGHIADSAVIVTLILIAVGRIASGLLFEDTSIGLDLQTWFVPEDALYEEAAPEEDEEIWGEEDGEVWGEDDEVWGEDDEVWGDDSEVWGDDSGIPDAEALPAAAEDPAAPRRYSFFTLKDHRFFERFPFAVKNYYGEWSWAVFVPEALWALGIALILWRARAREGGRTALFVLLYACGQIFLEGLKRGEVLHLPWLNFVRANQILCAIAIVAVWAVCCRGSGAGKGRILVSLAQILLAMGVVVAMEFSTFEQKISFLARVPVAGCFLIMLGACAWMALAILPLWRRKYSVKTDR